ncbi:MAG TPA: hypothetical protein VK638_05500, partial [Edaphobacter sp.]|nr:hypothetical protein [Edaphobacter sp.]
ESEALLDNPIWNSLATRHAHLAIGADIGHGLARRYPGDIGPLSAVQELTSEAYADPRLRPTRELFASISRWAYPSSHFPASSPQAAITSSIAIVKEVNFI